MLLVEDDPITYTALRAILRHRGMEVTLATTLAAGLENLNDTADVVILDLMLPDGNGLEVLRAARALGLANRVIVTTGSGEPAMLAAVTDLRPQAMLRKPININELFQMLPGGNLA